MFLSTKSAYTKKLDGVETIFTQKLLVHLVQRNIKYHAELNIYFIRNNYNFFL